MKIRAERDPRFYLRFVIIGWVAIGFALWSLYDGAVKYPQQRERGLAFEKLMEEGRDNEWDKYATERGWPTEYPGEPKSEADIKMQYVMVAVAGLIGALVLLNVWLSRGRWIEADDEGLNSSWGERVPYSSIVSLDKKIWRSKGIAKVKYNDGTRARRFVIDDYKFMRESTDNILYELEERIEPDKIVGGPPEPLREPASEAIQAADRVEST
jgi:hypothetical protein